MKRISKKKKHLKYRQSLKIKKIARRQNRKKAKESNKPNDKWWDRSIDAPVSFSLRGEKDRFLLLNFIQDVFSNTTEKEKLRLNFEHTEYLIVDALLLFIANIKEALLQKNKFSTIRIAPSNKRSINAVLTQLGVLELCGQDYHINPKEEEGIIDWCLLSGTVNNKLNPKEIYHFLKDSIHQDPPRVLSKAVNEALLNIKHHAYKNMDSGTWWVVVHKNEQTKCYTIVVCDRGIGIPISIKKGNDAHQRLLQRYLNKLRAKIGRDIKDSEMIRISMKLGETSTGEIYRGKGLPAMKNVVELFPNESLLLNIYSNNGCYSKISKVKKVKLEEYSESIKGTVVAWTIPLNIDSMIEI